MYVDADADEAATAYVDVHVGADVDRYVAVDIDAAADVAARAGDDAGECVYGYAEEAASVAADVEVGVDADVDVAVGAAAHADGCVSVCAGRCCMRNLCEEDCSLAAWASAPTSSPMEVLALPAGRLPVSSAMQRRIGGLRASIALMGAASTPAQLTLAMQEADTLWVCLFRIVRCHLQMGLSKRGLRSLNMFQCWLCSCFPCCLER